MHAVCLAALSLILLGLLILATMRLDLRLQPASCTSKGAAKRADTRAKIHVPKFMMELYEESKGRAKGHSKPDIVRSLIPKHADSYYGENEVIENFSDNHLLIFDLPNAMDEEELVSAELKVFTLVDVSSGAVSGVERQLRIAVYDDTTKELHFSQEMRIVHLNNTWLSFNLTRAVWQIMQTAHNVKYLKVIISVIALLPYISPSNLRLSLLPITDSVEHNYPVLLLYYAASAKPKKAKAVRAKRSAEEDYEEETNQVWSDEGARKALQKRQKRVRNSCRRRPLYINFSEIEYDTWIVQPLGYEVVLKPVKVLFTLNSVILQAYQCQGKCFYPVAEHLNPTKHAIIQALLHSVAPAKAPRSCCVPTSLDSISVLYVDVKGVLTYRYAYKDMVVVECGCR